MVKRGMTNEIRDAIGLLNSKVGYVYLLDGKCRIRWAGSGICEGDEKEGLAKGVRRLIEEAKQRKVEKPVADAPAGSAPTAKTDKAIVGKAAVA